MFASLRITVNIKAITDKLKLCLEPEFSVLKTTRAWLSFSDGLYGTMIDTFVPYSQLQAFGIPAGLAACNFHNVKFRPATVGHPLLQVQTPLLDEIVETQGLCGYSKFWIFACLGKALHWNQTFDAWQIALYLKGLAGKVTLHALVLMNQL